MTYMARFEAGKYISVFAEYVSLQSQVVVRREIEKTDLGKLEPLTTFIKRHGGILMTMAYLKGLI